MHLIDLLIVFYSLTKIGLEDMVWCFAHFFLHQSHLTAADRVTRGYRVCVPEPLSGDVDRRSEGGLFPYHLTHMTSHAHLTVQHNRGMLQKMADSAANVAAEPAVLPTVCLNLFLLARGLRFLEAIAGCFSSRSGIWCHSDRVRS